MSNLEQTLSIIKPDAVERNLIDKIKVIFEKNHLQIKDQKKIHISKDEAAWNFTKSISQSLFIMICVHIYHLDQLL